MTSMLHALSSTFTTCACGAKTRDCALNRLAEFVDGQTPPTPSPSPPTHHAEDPFSRSEAWDRDGGGRRAKPDLGPLIGVERGFRTKERVPMSGGMSGVEMVSPTKEWTNGWNSDPFSEAGPSRLVNAQVQSPLSPKSTTSKTWDRKGKGRATDDEIDVEKLHREEAPTKRAAKSRAKRKNGTVKPTSTSSASSSGASPRTLLAPQLVPENEEKLPPKFRKKWIHEKADSLSDTPISPSIASPARRTDGIRDKKDMLEVEELSDGAYLPTQCQSLSESFAVLDAKVMPPPPLPLLSIVSPTARLNCLPNLPSPLPNHLPDPTSPTASFANLSLLSPALNGVPARSNTKSPQLERPVWAKSEVMEDADMKDESLTLPSALSRRPPDVSPVHAPPISMLPRPSSPIEERQVRRAAAAIADLLVPVSSQSDEPLSHTDMQVDQQLPTAAPASSPTTEAPADHTNPDPAPDVFKEELQALPEPATERPSETEDAVKIEPPKTPPHPVVEEPPPKVKLSLKDFALRKKKQREEIKASSSPSVPAVLLAPEYASAEPTITKTVVAVPAESVANVPELPHDIPVAGAAGSNESKQEGQDVAMGAAMGAEKTSVIDSPPKSHDVPREAPADTPGQQAAATDVCMDVDEGSVSLTTKVESVEERLPSASPPRIVVDFSPLSPTRRPEPPTDHPPSSSSQTNQENTEPRRAGARSPVPSHSQLNIARTVSREDGEIFSPPPPKPLPLAPRAHSPPTHPRSFHVHSGSTSPVRPPQPPPPPRRPLQPAPHRSQLQTGVLNSRPLPSGPRALRGLGGGNGGHFYPPFSGGGVAPRAPSADRDRDHRMDWDRDNRRGSSWGRGRGGGGWVR